MSLDRTSESHSRHNLAAIALLAALGAAGWSCEAQRLGEVQPVTTQSRPIINGTPDDSAQHMAIVMLYNRGNGSMCSGTLIAPRVVLTAGHCVYGTNPRSIEVCFGTSADYDCDWHAVSEGAVHPAYDPGNGTNPPRNDIALLRLSGPAPSGVQPIPVLPPNLGLTQADVSPNPIQVTFVGFGMDEHGNTGTKLTITLPLAQVCTGPDICFLEAGNVGGIAAPMTLGFLIQNGGPCSGDSGGPALVQRGGSTYVAGINSYGDQNCQAVNFGTYATAHWNFIQNFIQGTNALEVCSGGLDENSDGLIDCADPDCSSYPACRPPAWTTSGELCYQRLKPCSDGSRCNALLIQGWPVGAGICTPECSNPGATNGECYSGGPGIGMCGLSQGNDNYCVLVCGSLLGESCPPGLVCRDSQTGALNPQQGLCVPEHAVVEVYCHNNEDDDQDGLADCNDPDCAQSCQGSKPEDCSNGVDDDQDGLTDCADPDCAQACQNPGSENCFNNSDDDGDGLVDCADPDCAQACQNPGSENCFNNSDDDGDGLVDCADPDCAEACTSDSGSGSGGGCRTAGAPDASALLFVLGLLGFAWRRRRR